MIRLAPVLVATALQPLIAARPRQEPRKVVGRRP